MAPPVTWLVPVLCTPSWPNTKSLEQMCERRKRIRLAVLYGIWANHNAVDAQRQSEKLSARPS
jgi:hypothetical protein